MTGDMFIYLSSFSYKNGFWPGFFSLFHWKPANQLYVNRLTDNKLPAVKLPTTFRREISAFGGVTVSRIWFNRWCVGMIFVQYFIIFVCHEILKMLWFITNFLQFSNVLRYIPVISEVWVFFLFRALTGVQDLSATRRPWWLCFGMLKNGVLQCC